jgi:hypothetical protein
MIWFAKEHAQQVTLKTYTGLVGKAPTKAKRLRMAFTLDLTSGDVKGMPDWMQDARDFVMRTGQTVTENLSVPGVNISFGDPNLFKKKPVEAPRADLRKFKIYSAGDAEEPDTLLSFFAYCSFSTDLNRWLGQMNGEAFTATFDGVVSAPQPGDVVLVSPGAADEDEDDDDDSGDGDDDEDEGDPAAANESQSAKAARIRKTAEANAAKAKPAARPAISFTKPNR